jgi:hypothetical protein
MKFSRFIPAIVVALLSYSCNPSGIDIPDHNQSQDQNQDNNNSDNGGNEQTPGTEDQENSPIGYPTAGMAKTKTLLTTDFFTETKIKDGITLYQAYRKMDEVSKAYQNVSVLEVDLNNEAYKISFKRVSRDSTTSIGRRLKAIAAINAAYEQEASYIRINGINYSEVSILPDDPQPSKARRFWKHEAAIVSDGFRKVGLVYGAKGQDGITSGGIQAINIYKSITEPNLFSGSPMLIDEYDPVGTRFVPSEYDHLSISDFTRIFDSEDYRCHQGIRHPRTAVALTEDNDLLFIVVDGRFPGKAEGMSARELTKFIAKHFNPKWAINMDGGGSSSMYIDGHGCAVNNIVNYPCNDGDGVWDQVGQRMLSTFFLVEYDE